MGDKPEIVDEESFAAWLDSHDKATKDAYAKVIARRVALRVLPFLGLFRLPDTESKISFDLFLQNFRATNILSFYNTFFTHDNSLLAAIAAVESAWTSADSAAYSNALSSLHKEDQRALSSCLSILRATKTGHYFLFTIDDTIRCAVDAFGASDSKQEIWTSIQADARELHSGMFAQSLEQKPIWLNATPKWFSSEYNSFKQLLKDDGPHWGFWLDWYEAKVVRQPMPHLGTAGEDFIGQKLAEQEGDFWKQGPEAVGRALKRWYGEWYEIKDEAERFGDTVFDEPDDSAALLQRALRAQRKLLAQTASPHYKISKSGAIDAVPNGRNDAPLSDAELLNLPEMQRSLIETIRATLMQLQAPNTVIDLLDAYKREIDARGVEVIMGVLDQFAILLTIERNKQYAGSWADNETICATLDMFANNHAQMKSHYPFDGERIAALDQTNIDLELTITERLDEALSDYAGSIQSAQNDGLVTDNFVSVEESRIRHSRDVLNAPIPVPVKGPPELVARQEDRIQQVILAKKRTLGSALGSADALLDKAEKVSSFADSTIGKAIIGSATTISKIIYRGMGGA